MPSGPVGDIKEAFNKSIGGMIASGSSSDLREMRAKRDFSVTKTAKCPNNGVHALPGMLRCKVTLTDIMKILIAAYRTFTISRELITCFRTQGL